MRRLEIHAYGPLRSAVRYADAPMPAVGAQDLLVRVQAAAINPIDYKIAHGDLRRVQALELPGAFGYDACGRVEAVGSAVTRYQPGDAVYLRAPRERMGSFAEFMAVDARHAAPQPASLSALEAASIPLVALTTVQGLVDRAHAQAGQSILIHAGSGGLGSFAVQYAKHVLGLTVTTTTSSKNVDWVRALGADVVLAYDREDYAALPARYDIVFDTLGGKTTADSFGVLKHGGTVVSVAGPPDQDFARQVGAGPLVAAVMWCMGLGMRQRARTIGGRYFRFLTDPGGAQLEAVTRALEAGQVKPVIDRVFPFDQAIEALEYAAAGRAKGKVMIQVAA